MRIQLPLPAAHFDVSAEQGAMTNEPEETELELGSKELDAASSIARRYRLVLESQCDGTYHGSSVELPGVFVREPSVERCSERLFEALTYTVAILRAQGKPVPSPASEHKRDRQVNLRLTSAEHYSLEEAARRDGSRTLADFIRSAALSRTRAILQGT